MSSKWQRRIADALDMAAIAVALLGLGLVYWVAWSILTFGAW